MSKEKMLPMIKDLYFDKIELSKQNELNVLLNQEPKEEWVKKHPLYDGLKYLPIERIEWLMTSIFIKWYVEVKSIQLIANSVVVCVRVHYQNPTNSEMLFQDGIGAAPLQTSKGAGAADWDKIKNDAVMKAAPAAKSFAVKDACEVIGKLFGKDFNRSDWIMYNSLQGRFDLKEKPKNEKYKDDVHADKQTLRKEDLSEMFLDCRTVKEVIDIWWLLTKEQQSDQEIKDWKGMRISQLNDGGIYA